MPGRPPVVPHGERSDDEISDDDNAAPMLQPNYVTRWNISLLKSPLFSPTIPSIPSLFPLPPN